MIMDSDVSLPTSVPQTDILQVDAMAVPVVQLSAADSVVPSLDDIVLTQLPPPMTPIREVPTAGSSSAVVTENLLLTRQMPVPFPTPSTSAASAGVVDSVDSTNGSVGYRRGSATAAMDMPLILAASPQPSIEGDEVSNPEPVRDKENVPPLVGDGNRRHRHQSSFPDRRPLQVSGERVRPDLIRKRRYSLSSRATDEDRCRRVPLLDRRPWQASAMNERHRHYY